MGHPVRESSPAQDRSATQRRAVLGVACAAQLMVVLDVSVVNVALPSIGSDLGFTAAGLQWVANAYLLVFGGLLLLGGRLADLHGRRRVFLAGLVVFSAASLIGGVATSPVTLIAARAGQGVGAAILAPTTLTLLTTTFDEGARRTRALATWTAVSVAGGAVGNLLGGVLTEFLSWRATLLINVPLGALAVLLALRALPQDDLANPHRRLDVLGAALATPGLTAVTYAVTRVQTHGWTDRVTLFALGGGVVLLVALLLVEARVSAPLLPLRLFGNRAVATGNLVMLLAGACFQAPMWFFLTFYMQDVLHYTAARTGLGFLPHTLVSIAVGWLLAPRLMHHLSARTLVVLGALVAAAGFVWQSGSTPGTGYLVGIFGPALLISFGGGLLNTPLTATVTSGVAAAEAGAASGLMNTTKQVGGALGLSSLITLAARGGTTDYSTAFRCLAAILVVAAAAAMLLPTQRDRPN